MSETDPGATTTARAPSRGLTPLATDAVLALAMLLSTLLVWLPHLGDPAVLYRYWDGPLYAYVAHTLYDIPADHPIAAGLPPAFFCSYLPAYPLAIRLLLPVLGPHYGPPMLAATVLSSMAAIVLFHRVLRAYDLVQSPVWTALLFCVLPPRWLVYHSVGGTEPLFFCFLFGAMLAHARRRIVWLIACIVAASLTRITGALLVPVFAGLLASRRDWRGLAMMPLAAAGTLGLFTFYGRQFGDFFAYLTWQGKIGGLVGPVPLGIALDYARSPDHRAAELMVVLYAVLAVGTALLVRHRDVFVLCAAFLAFDLFMYNSDMVRIAMPSLPFALLVGFDPVLHRKEARFALAALLPLLYAYAWGTLPHNLLPQADYEALLRVFGAS